MEVAALFLGQVLVLSILLRQVKVVKSVPTVNIPYVGPQAFQVQQYPFSGSLATVTVIGATFTTQSGSSAVDDLLQFTADSADNAFQIESNDTSSVSLVATSKIGFVILTGTGTIVEYTQTTREGPQVVQVNLTSSPTSIELSLASELVITSVGQAALWFAAEAAGVYSQYLMQTFVSQGQAMSLRVTELNNVFYVTGAFVNRVFLQPSMDLLTPLPNDAGTTNFYDLINTALQGLSLTARLQSFTSDARSLQSGQLMWVNTGTSAVTISVVNAERSSAQQAAMAATLGLYNVVEGSSPTIVSLTVPADGLAYWSPSPVFVQMPVFTPQRRLVIPGSANTDGLVQIYEKLFGATEWTLAYQYYASSNEYFVKGPNFLMTYDTSFVIGNSGVPLNIVFQTLTDSTNLFFSFQDTPAWQDFAQGQSVALRINDVTYSSQVVSGTQLTFTVPTVFEPSQLIIEFVDTVVVGRAVLRVFSEPQRLYTSFGSTLGRAVSYPSGTLDNTWLYGSNGPLNFAGPPIIGTQLRIVAWGGGGANVGRFFGGSASRISVDIVLTDVIRSLRVRVGSKGTQNGALVATGGQSTYVYVNEQQVLHSGGGGGATVNSHGGCGGFAQIEDATQATVGPGLSGSQGPFDNLFSGDNPQTYGPDEVPLDLLGNPDYKQGLGSDEDGGTNGSLGNTLKKGRIAGLGGTGYGTLGVTQGGYGVGATIGLGTPLGAGGGGCSYVIGTGTYDGFNVFAVDSNPPWVSVVYSGPLGGGEGPFNPYAPGPYPVTNLQVVSRGTNFITVGWTPPAGTVTVTATFNGVAGVVIGNEATFGGLLPSTTGDVLVTTANAYGTTESPPLTTSTLAQSVITWEFPINVTIPGTGPFPSVVELGFLNMPVDFDYNNNDSTSANFIAITRWLTADNYSVNVKLGLVNTVIVPSNVYNYWDSQFMPSFGTEANPESGYYTNNPWLLTPTANTFTCIIQTDGTPMPPINYVGNVKFTMTYNPIQLFGSPISSLQQSPEVDYYVPVYAYGDSCSLMQGVIENIWNQSTQSQWTTNVLAATAANLNGSLAAVGRANNVISINEDAFTSPDLQDPTSSAISYLPLGPHDATLPLANSTAVRLITNNERVVLDEGLTLCIHNDGHFTTLSIANAANTAIFGPANEIGIEAYVVRAVIGRSQPAGLFSCLYLTLNRPLSSTTVTGPYYWDFMNPDDPPAFSVGTVFHGTTSAPWLRTFPLTIAPREYASLTEALYRSMAHTFLSTTQNTAVLPSYMPNTFTLPSDTPSGPSYLQSIWPVEYTASNVASILSLRTFVRPSAIAPIVNFANVRASQAFVYDGPQGYDPMLPLGFQSFNVPANVRTLNVYAFGAGGSTLGLNAGAPGSFAYANFSGLAGKTLYVYVGVPGGSQSGSGPTFGGRDVTGQYTLGGGLSGIYDGKRWLIVAAGGGCGSVNSPGVREPAIDVVVRRAPQDGVSRAVRSTNGQNSRSRTSGAGGNGVSSGSSGQSLFSGGSGFSLVPRTGFVSGSLNQKFARPDIGFGAPGLLSLSGFPKAGPGLVVVEFTY